jgi:uncharacterized repeat protein (TIGR03803 family)
MKKNFLLLLLASISLTPGFAVAQTTPFQTIYSFQGQSDGSMPYAGLVYSNGVFYGTTFTGPTVFALTNNGGFKTLANLSYFPYPGVFLSGTNLYGIAEAIVPGQQGYMLGITAFDVSTAGNYEAIQSTTEGPQYSQALAISRMGGLTLQSNTLYGTLPEFEGNLGHVFALNTNVGSSFQSIHDFAGEPDGEDPAGTLVISGSTLYGTASANGPNESGTLFSIDVSNGNFFTLLHAFSGENSDGDSPVGPLILLSNTLYGTTAYGGANGSGAIFSYNIGTSSYTTLYSFSPGQIINGYQYPINSDGSDPEGGVILANNTLYGTAQFGGTNGYGTVFAYNIGTGIFTTLHTFSSLDQYYSNGDGAFPRSSLLLLGNTLFGTASQGGSAGGGTVFSLGITLPPPPPNLTITISIPGGGVHKIFTVPDPGSVTVTVNATASEVGGSISQVVFYVDGKVSQVSTTSPFTMSLVYNNQNTPNPTSHTVYADATDNNGNTAASAPITFSLQTTNQQ